MYLFAPPPGAQLNNGGCPRKTVQPIDNGARAPCAAPLTRCCRDRPSIASPVSAVSQFAVSPPRSGAAPPCHILRVRFREANTFQIGTDAGRSVIRKAPRQANKRLWP